MEQVVPILAIAAGYLSGSVNWAILVTRAVTGRDIRDLGNHNPGMSNVLRSVGRGWGLLVLLLDTLKGLVPVVLARILLWPEDRAADSACLYLVGMAAVLGHCKPVFHGFRGGGGISTMLGVSLFFVPVEFVVSLLAGGLVSMRFFRRTEHKFTQWTPIMFVILTPVLATLTTLLLDVPLFAHVGIGGNPWTVPAGAWAMSFLLLWLNRDFMKRRSEEYQGTREG